ncbi:BspA family leucine-rich repeat surface protein, partial [Lactiplantibacillus paraplantarum]
MKDKQAYVVMSARKNRRFWLAAGTALLVWQVNNQAAQADVSETPTSSADTTVITASGSSTANVVQLQSGAKSGTAATTTDTGETNATSVGSTAADTTKVSASGASSTDPDTAKTDTTSTDSTATGDGKVATSASQNDTKPIAEQPTTNTESVTTVADNHSESTTPSINGTNTVSNETDAPVTGSQLNTASQLTADISESATNKTDPSSPTQAPSVIQSAQGDSIKDTTLYTDGYNETNTTDPAASEETVIQEPLSSKYLRANSLRLNALVAAPAVAQDYAAWDAITDTSRKGVMGTSEWWIDDSDNTLHIGAGQLADTNTKFDASGNVTDWGNLGWGQYLQTNSVSPKLVLEGTVVTGKSARGLFTKLTLPTLDFSTAANQFGGQLDTSNTVDMSYMFEKTNLVAEYAELPGVNMDGVDTSHVTDVSHMFEQCQYSFSDSSLHPDARRLSMLLNVDFNKVTNTSYMFNGFGQLKVLSFYPGFTLANVTSMSYMFNGCYHLSSVGGITFDISNATDTSYMFAGAEEFGQNDSHDEGITFYCGDNQTISTNMSHMFSGARDMVRIKFEGSGNQLVTNAVSMFEDCGRNSGLDMTGLNTSHVTDMSSMFAGSAMSLFDFSTMDTSQVTNMSSMFARGSSSSVIDLSNLDTSQVTNMSSMFAGSQWSSIDLSPLDTSHVTDMSSMFAGCTWLSAIDLPNIDTGKLTNMSSMFKGCHGLITMDLSAIDTSSVQNMSSLFASCIALSSINLVGANTSQVTNMSSMFEDCRVLSSIDLSAIDTSRVTNMSALFSGCSSLVSVDLSGLNTSSVTNMSAMFLSCVKLPKIDISNLDTSKVDNMSAMFSICTSLVTLDLTNFNTTNVRDMAELFAGDSALKKLDISSLDMSNVQFQAGHYSPATHFKTYWLFNYVAAAMDSEYNMDLTTIKVNRTTKLSLPEIEATKVSDIVDPMVADGTSFEEWLEAFKQYGINIADLSNAGLRDSQGYDKLWINNETGETLTAAQLMARYDGNNPLATDATWTWQNILGQDKQVISGKNSTWAPSDSLAGLSDTSKTVNDLTTTITDTTTNQTLTSAELNALLQQPTHAGQYHVAYQYIDGDGTKQISVPVTLSLVANQSVLTTKDSVVQLGATWTAADNIDSLLDADGTTSELTKVSGVVSVNGVVGATVDTTAPGVYQVNYQMTDSTGISRTATATIIVNGLTLNKAQVDVSTDDHWDPATNVAVAIDDLGKATVVALTITANGVEVNNLKKPGTYQISYHFKDDHGEHVQTAVVNVKAGTNYAGLTVKDSSVYQFGTWNSAANFVSAVDSDGEQLDMSAVTVIGTVAVNTVGSYVIEYQFTDQFGTLQSKKATVTVLKNQADISVINNSGTLYAGGEWKPSSIAVTAKDVDGSDVEADKIQVAGVVDMSKAGNYQLAYSFTDRLRHPQSQVVTVAVLENQASIEVKNNSDKLYVGGTWNPSDMVVTAKDVDDSDVEADKIQVTGAVNMSKAGNYDLTYSFTDSLGHLQSYSVTVSVLENQASIEVTNKSDKLYADCIWNPNNIEVTAKDVDGSTVPTESIQVTGVVDMSKAGDYQLTYSFTDRLGHSQSKTVTVSVLENQVSIEV